MSATRVLICIVFLGRLLSAAEPDPVQLEEDRVWAEEDLLLNKCCDEKPSGLEKSLTGVITLEKTEFTETEALHPEKVTVGTLSSGAITFPLRVASAALLDVIKKFPSGKPVYVRGHVRVNGKYFVVADALITLPGEGITAPVPRKKRGGM